MALIRPSLNKIPTFDAFVGTTLNFSWTGGQAKKNRIIIREYDTQKKVYDCKEKTIALRHTLHLPITKDIDGSYVQEVPYALKNGKRYVATVIVYDMYDMESLTSNEVNFYCFATPVIEFTNFDRFDEKTGVAKVSYNSIYLNVHYQQKDGEVINEYGFILYDYEEVDYRWNMSTVLDVELIKQTDKVTLNEGLAYLDNVLFQYYTDDFKKHYFPFKILLADSVQVLKNGVWYPDEPATAGLSFLGIGRIRNGIGEIPADSLFELRGKVQAAFWANFLYNNEMMDLPEAFWNISEDYYGGNLKLVDGNSGLKPDEIDMKKYGFWDRDRTADNGTNYCMAPNKTLDINQFIDMVTTHTTAEMEALIAPYDRLKDKYHLLVNQLKEVYGVDIQAIGNDQY